MTGVTAAEAARRGRWSWGRYGSGVEVHVGDDATWRLCGRLAAESRARRRQYRVRQFVARPRLHQRVRRLPCSTLAASGYPLPRRCFAGHGSCFPGCHSSTNRLGHTARRMGRGERRRTSISGCRHIMCRGYACGGPGSQPPMCSPVTGLARGKAHMLAHDAAIRRRQRRGRNRRGWRRLQLHGGDRCHPRRRAHEVCRQRRALVGLATERWTKWKWGDMHTAACVSFACGRVP